MCFLTCRERLDLDKRSRLRGCQLKSDRILFSLVRSLVGVVEKKRTQEIIPLFNPRQQNWSDHFIALLSLQENKNSSQRMEPLLNGQFSDRKLIETHVLSPNGRTRYV